MKGQSIFIQFILFLVISFSIFIGLTNWYNLRKIYFHSSISNISKELIANFVLNDVLKMYTTSGDYIERNLSLPNKTLDYFYMISFINNQKLEVLFLPNGGSFHTEVLGLNYSLPLYGSVVSIQKIRLIKNNDQINIVGD